MNKIPPPESVNNCTLKKPCRSEIFPPKKAPTIEPTPNKPITMPASLKFRPTSLLVRYSVIKGNTMVPLLLINITKESSQFCLDKPVKEFLYNETARTIIYL